VASTSLLFFFSLSVDLRDLPSFPTRRSSDLPLLVAGDLVQGRFGAEVGLFDLLAPPQGHHRRQDGPHRPHDEEGEPSLDDLGEAERRRHREQEGGDPARHGGSAHKPGTLPRLPEVVGYLHPGELQVVAEQAADLGGEMTGQITQRAVGIGAAIGLGHQWSPDIVRVFPPPLARNLRWPESEAVDMTTPATKVMMPTHWERLGRSPRNTHARRAIWISMVLLIAAEAVADRRRSDQFHMVNASAVLATASHATISHPAASRRGTPSVANPTATSNAAPIPMLSKVTTSAGNRPLRLTRRPRIEAPALDPRATAAATIPVGVNPRAPLK